MSYSNSRAKLLVHLERWREDKFYDRFGLDEETVNILGIDILSTASSATRRCPRLISSMAVSLFPTPLSPVISTPSP